MIKEWAISIVSVLIGLSVERLELCVLCLLCIGIMLIFWVLNAFFLKMEKCYRFKYECIISERQKNNCEYLYDLNPYKKETRKYDRKTPSVVSVMFSKPCTLLLFYGFPIVVAFVAFIINLI